LAAFVNRLQRTHSISRCILAIVKEQETIKSLIPTDNGILLCEQWICNNTLSDRKIGIAASFFVCFPAKKHSSTRQKRVTFQRMQTFY
jgi:hypothetical protein